MKTKHIIFLLGIVGVMGSCKKTSGNLYAGRYACVVTYESGRFTQNGTPYYFDTIIGVDTITISGKSPSSLIQTGNFLAPSYDTLNGNSLVSYSNDSIYNWSDNHDYERESAVFFRANDSMSITYEKGGSQRAELYFYNGHKIH